MGIKFDQLLEALKLDESLSLYESKWDYELSCGPALRKAIHDENYFEVMKQLRKAWQELFDNDKIDDWDYERGIEDLDDLQFVDDEDLEDALNYVLADFYDLCDNLRIWVPLLENLNEDFVESTYKVGDKVFKGDANGYQGLFLIKGDIKNLPKELYKYIRNIYFKREPDTYSVEFLLPDGYDLFKEDYEKFYDMIRPILLDNGLTMLDESLNESYDSMWIIIPVERRYDELTPSDYLKFAKQYGTFNNQKDCFDKIEELAPDRWEAFIPLRIDGE